MKWLAVFWIVACCTEAAADTYKQMTVDERLKEADHVSHIVLTDYVGGFFRKSVLGKEYETLHKYKVTVVDDLSGTLSNNFVCFDSEFNIGDEVIVMSLREDAAQPDAEYREAIRSECAGGSVFFETLFNREAALVVSHLIGDEVVKFAALSDELYRAGASCSDCLTQELIVRTTDGEELQSSREILVPLTSILAKDSR